MTTLVALYHSTDEDSDEYWDIKEIGLQYDITIRLTEDTDWGGENIFEIEGKRKNLEEFADEFCSGTLEDLYPSNKVEA